jgi:uncharacterized protein (TIGR02145 family)
MTYAQRNAIVNPAAGLIVYCTDCANGEMQYYNGTNWINMSVGIGSLPPTLNLPSVTIGTQIWTSQNLNVSTYRDGTPIPQVEDAATWGSLTTGAYCYYNNDSATYAAVYGKLYNWYAVHDPRGLAPVGWHVPSEYEWNLLFKCLDNNADTTSNCSNCWISQSAGGKLKETGFQHWTSPNTGATNDFGFSGIAAGSRYDNGEFHDVGLLNHLWSNLPDFQNDAWYHNLIQWGPSIFQGKLNKKYGFSVRCLRE